MAQNKKTQRKFRKKSSKRNVGKRKTKVKRKMKGGNCYEVYDNDTKKYLNEAYVNYRSFIQNVYFKEPEISALQGQIEDALKYGVADENMKKELKYLLNSEKNISHFTNMINEKPIHTLLIGIEYIIRTYVVFTTVKCNTNENLRRFYIKNIEIIYLAIELITQSLQKIIGRSDVWDKCKRKKSWTYAITSTGRNHEYVQCITNKITIYDRAISAIGYLIKFFQQMVYATETTTTPEQNVDITYHVELLTAEEKNPEPTLPKPTLEEVNKIKSEKKIRILEITPTLCEKLRTLLEPLLPSDKYKIISTGKTKDTKENAIQSLTYCKELLKTKKGIKEAKISTSPSSDTDRSSELGHQIYDTRQVRDFSEDELIEVI
jgi:hypothetical protein